MWPSPNVTERINLCLVLQVFHVRQIPRNINSNATSGDSDNNTDVLSASGSLDGVGLVGYHTGSG